MSVSKDRFQEELERRISRRSLLRSGSILAATGFILFNAGRAFASDGSSDNVTLAAAPNFQSDTGAEIPVVSLTTNAEAGPQNIAAAAPEITLNSPRDVKEFLGTMDLTDSAYYTIDGQRYGIEMRATRDSLFQATFRPKFKDDFMQRIAADQKRTGYNTLATIAMVSSQSQFPMWTRPYPVNVGPSDSRTRTNVGYITAFSDGPITGGALFYAPNPDLETEDFDIMDGNIDPNDDNIRKGGVNETVNLAFISMELANGEPIPGNNELVGKPWYLKAIWDDRPIVISRR